MAGMLENFARDIPDGLGVVSDVKNEALRTLNLARSANKEASDAIGAIQDGVSTAGIAGNVLNNNLTLAQKAKLAKAGLKLAQNSGNIQKVASLLVGGDFTENALDMLPQSIRDNFPGSPAEALQGLKRYHASYQDYTKAQNALLRGDFTGFLEHGSKLTDNIPESALEMAKSVTSKLEAGWTLFQANDLGGTIDILKDIMSNPVVVNSGYELSMRPQLLQPLFTEQFKRSIYECNKGYFDDYPKKNLIWSIQNTRNRNK